MAAEEKGDAEGEGGEEVGAGGHAVAHVADPVDHGWEDGGGERRPDAAQEPLEVLTLGVHHVHGPLDPRVGVGDLILPFLGGERHAHCSPGSCLLQCEVKM